jgi:hypothetical protein
MEDTVSILPHDVVAHLPLWKTVFRFFDPVGSLPVSVWVCEFLLFRPRAYSPINPSSRPLNASDRLL